ncbi:hypothetical protein HYU07_06550 [Candidatus Woesearchaeota archaeon]|nr:hypothetical protein [Candidatus Woesearchaeota archaeon]
MTCELAKREKSGLETIGGFDSYQGILYKEIKKAMLAMESKEILDFNMYLRTAGACVDGLEQGLCGYFANPRPLSEHNLNCIEDPLNIYIADCIMERIHIPQQDKEYWEREAEEWHSVDGTTLKNRFAGGPPKDIISITVNPEFAIFAAIKRESDRIINERKHIKLLPQ